MARVCEICGRGTVSSQKRSHSNIKTKIKKYINLQTKTIDGKRLKVCTSCIRNLSK